MGDQSTRQLLRQRAGFLAENLLQRSFEERGVLAVSHVRRHLDEAGKSVGTDWMQKARILAKSAGRVQGLVGDRLRAARPGLIGDYRLSRAEAAVRALLGFCDMIRWEGDTPILSEIKSQLGPEVDYRIEFQATQMIALRDLSAVGASVTVLYYVALPRPTFVEVPWVEFRKPARNVRTSDIGEGFRFRTRVPIAYRDRARFTAVPDSVVPYRDESELLRFLAKAFQPGSRPGLAND